jgi:hypothetical protein
VRLLPLLFGFCLAANTHAALPGIAFFTGTLQGETQIAGLPPLTWTLFAAPARDGQKSAHATLDAEGLSLRIQFEADLAGETLAWKITEGRLALGPWFRALAPRLPAVLSSASLTGELRISGSGRLDDMLRPLGRVSLTCTDAVLENPSAGWALAGVSLAGDFDLGPDLAITSAGPATLGIQTIRTSRFGARALTLAGELGGGRQLFVTAARIEIAGGEVSIPEPFTVPLSPMTVSTRVRMQRVGLQDFVALIPSGLSDARGRLNGDVRLLWSQTGGLQLGLGTLSLDESESTVIRLARSPGFLTGSMPARIGLLPGFLGRLVYAPNPSLKDLREIELGEAELQVNSLHLRLTPDGDERGRSAFVQVDARPLQPRGTVERVTFDINVAGPYAPLLRIGLNQPFTMQVR